MASKYLLCVIAIVIISAAYWSAFGINAYNNYHEYSDLGIHAYDMYYHVNYPGILNGIQYLIVGNHTSLDALFLFLPFFAIFQSAVTLLILQAIILSLTGFVVFIIARKLLSNERTAFLLFLAFLLNPGVIAILVFDFHLEVLIPLFMLLTFYFFVEKKKVLFIISTALLLGSVEIVCSVALMLGVGLIFYAEHLAQGKKVDRSYLFMALTLVLMAAIAWCLYNGVYSVLVHAYSSNAYPNLPITLKALTFDSGQISSFLSRFSSGGYMIYYMPFYTTRFALVIAFFSFGIAAGFELFVLLLIISPWFFEVVILQNANFVNLFNQYFAVALGGMMIATLMSLTIFQKQGKKQDHTHINWKFRKAIRPYLDHAIIVSLVVLLLIYLFLISSTNVESLKELLLLRVSPQEHAYNQQLSSIISAIPSNATVMAPYFVMPHLISREYLEIIPGPGQDPGVISSNAVADRWKVYDTWFIPEYIVEDPNPYVNNTPIAGFEFGDVVNSSELSAYGGTYKVYKTNGTATLLVREVQ